MKYINNYLSKQCSVDLQKLFSQSKNPLKEISESYGAYKNLVPYLENIKDVANIFIGDGSLCMTGVLFSFLTRNWSISIDPLINENKINSFSKEINLQHFIYEKSLFQNTMYSDYVKQNFKYYNIVLVHSHVNIREVIKKFPNWKYMYVNLCCCKNNQTFTIADLKERNIQVISYGVDNQILSEKNEVVIYKNGRFTWTNFSMLLSII